LEWQKRYGRLRDIALYSLILGQALLFQAQKDPSISFSSDNVRHIEDYLDQAVAGLRKVGQQQGLPRALLVRAAWYRLRQEFSKAWGDLDEVREITERGKMRIHLADLHLEFTRLSFCESHYQSAQNHLSIAARIIEETGYHRHDQEIKALRILVKNAELLQHENPELRKTAVKALEALERPEVFHLFGERLLKQDEKIEKIITNSLKKLSKSRVIQYIETSLFENGQIAAKALPVVATNEGIGTLLAYKYSHPEIDLDYAENSQVLLFRKISHVREFKRLWDQSESLITTGDMVTFSQSVSKISQTFCEALRLSSSKSQKISGMLSIGMVDISSILPTLPFNSKIPIVFAQSQGLLEQDLEKLPSILKHELPDAGRVVIMVLFVEPAQIKKLHTIVKQTLRKVFGYIILLLDYKGLIATIGAKNPQQTLRDILLSEIDLHSISPFTTDGPTPDNMFFGREKELWEICEYANKASFALIGGRKIGKTSILKRLERVRLPDANFQPYHFTCERMDQKEPTKSDFLQAVVNVWSPKKITESLNCFVDLLNYLPRSKPLVFLIDEVDRLIETDCRNGWPLFRELRALTEEKLCQFVFAGERILREAVHDSTGRLYNFPKVKKIGFLNFENVKELVTRPLKEMNIELVNEEYIVEKIWFFTMGHPNIVQKICARLIKDLDLKRERRISPHDVENVIAKPEVQHEDFLMVFWGHTTILERILTLVISQQESEYYSSRQIRRILQDRLNLSPKVREVNEALSRLVELRSILKKTSQGYYTFFVQTFPEVIAKTITAEDMLEELVEAYQEFGDIIEPTSYS